MPRLPPVTTQTPRSFATSIAISDTEILRQHALVPFEIVAGAAEAHLAFGHHVVAVAEIEGDAKVLLDEQHREPFVLEAAQHCNDLLDDDRRKAFRWLVEQDDFGIEHQR